MSYIDVDGKVRCPYREQIRDKCHKCKFGYCLVGPGIINENDCEYYDDYLTMKSLVGDII